MNWAREVKRGREVPLNTSLKKWPTPAPPPDATRCALTCEGEEKGHDDALPLIEGRMDGIPGRWRTFRTYPCPRLSSNERNTQRTNERGTEETTEKAKGGIRFSNKGGKHLLFATQLISTSSNYFSQLSLFRTVFETHRKPLTPTPAQSHRKNLLPKPLCFTSAKEYSTP